MSTASNPLSAVQTDLPPATVVTSARNEQEIRRNKRQIFELENLVAYNTANAMLTRSEIEENRASLMRNYSAAFMGNRTLATQNTRDLVRNRDLMIDALETGAPVKENFKRAMKNRARLVQLEHTSALNSRMLEINLKMVEINRMLIEINAMVTQANERIVEFNTEQVDENARLLDGELERMAHEASPESNAEAIAQNTEALDACMQRAQINGRTIEQLLRETDLSARTIQKAADEISDRLDKIRLNREKTSANQARTAEFLIGE